MYDWPRDRSNIYQTVLTISIWSWWVFASCTVVLLTYLLQAFLFNFIHVSTLVVGKIQVSRSIGIFVVSIHPPHMYTGTVRIEIFWARSTTQRFWPMFFVTCRSANYLLLHKALQGIGLFGLKMNRLPAVIGASLFFIVCVHFDLSWTFLTPSSSTCSLMIPLKRTWVRSGLISSILKVPEEC